MTSPVLYVNNAELIEIYGHSVRFLLLLNSLLQYMEPLFVTSADIEQVVEMVCIDGKLQGNTHTVQYAHTCTEDGVKRPCLGLSGAVPDLVVLTPGRGR